MSAIEQRDVARQRNRVSIRIGRLQNGYLITDGDGQGLAAKTRKEMHEMVDAIFDQIETDEESIPAAVNHRSTRPSDNHHFGRPMPTRP